LVVTTKILKQVLDEDGALRNVPVDRDVGVVGSGEGDLLLSGL
jgi:hypothetical protein